MRVRVQPTTAIVSAAVLALAGCGGGGGSADGPAAATEPATGVPAVLPHGSEPAPLDPADFTVAIDNPYWPMAPGTRWVYRETAPGGTDQRVVVTVTGRTRTIANGVRARVVRDVVTEGGTPVEVTDDWYAQDRRGNVWYLGESVRNFEDGRLVDRAGSFEAGVDGAEAGVVMPARPAVGMAYRQEYYAGEAEDRAEVVSVGDEQVGVPAGYWRERVLMTRDLVPTEPRVQELKFYVPGVGPVLALHTDGSGERAALMRFSRGR